jgi:hypothetical protein
VITITVPTIIRTHHNLRLFSLQGIWKVGRAMAMQLLAFDKKLHQS